jgi:nitrate/nitrite transport system substrate-binding protein
VSAPEVRIGVTPLTDCAPIAVAQELGHFAREGLRVTLSREPSWANIRDKLAAGALDAAQTLAPMTLAATLGVGPVHVPTVTGFSLGLGGNGITLSRALVGELLALDPGALDSTASRGRALAALVLRRQVCAESRLRLGTVFPFSMHSYALRYWLASAGIAPGRDVELCVVPPPRMVDALEGGALDGFCVGEPWNTLAAQRGIGALYLAVHELWPRAPEKVLAVTAAWLERNGEAHRALLRALLAAARWCDARENRAELAHLLAARGYVDAPEESLAPSLVGALESPAPGGAPLRDFHAFYEGAANFPWRSHALWIASQMVRWGEIEKPLDLRAACAQIYRADLYREAARDLGLAAPEADERIERLADQPFDPARAAEYATSFALAETRVVAGELRAAQRTRA